MADLLERLKAALADRYAIEREIGAGGMATVYLAEDLKHHRKVAVKVLRSELADSALATFERVLASHPGSATLQELYIGLLIGHTGPQPVLDHFKSNPADTLGMAADFWGRALLRHPLFREAAGIEN